MKHFSLSMTTLLLFLFLLPLLDKNAFAVTTSSVQTQASVGETLTLSISGIPAATAINTGNIGCTNTELTNSTASSSSTAVNLGQLTNDITIAAQLITITTNSASGYSLLANSNGFFTNSTNTFQFESSQTPASFPLSGHFFGIHPCGHDLSVSTWGSGKTTRGSKALYAWPPIETQLLIASDETGPIDTTVAPGNGVTTVQYAATIDATVPGGTYTGVITFTASPTF